MAGALVQLVAYSIENLYLTGDPQITFFKLVYRRYTNFAMESIPVSFSSPAEFGKECSLTLGNLGDAVGMAYLYVHLPEINSSSKIAWARQLGYVLLEYSS